MPNIIAFITCWFLFLFAAPCAGIAQSNAIDEAGTETTEQNASEQMPESPVTSSVEPDSDEQQEKTSSSVEEPKEQSEETSQQREQFRRALIHIKRAEALFGSDNYEAALAEYQQAYDLLQGHLKQFQTLYNIGLCHERLFRYDQALRYYKDYLDKGGGQAPNHAEVERVIQTLTHLLSTLRISVNTKADVWVDEVLVGRAPGDLLVAAGRHTIELRSPGYELAKIEVSVSAQKVKEIRFTLKKIEPDSDKIGGIHPAYFWTTSILSVVAFGLGSYFGVEYISTRDAMDKYYYEDNSKRISKANAYETRTSVALTVGGTLGVASAILFFLTDWDSEDNPSSDSASRQQRVRPKVEISAGGASLGLNAHF